MLKLLEGAEERDPGLLGEPFEGLHIRMAQDGGMHMDGKAVDIDGVPMRFIHVECRIDGDMPVAEAEGELGDALDIVEIPLSREIEQGELLAAYFETQSIGSVRRPHGSMRQLHAFIYDF